MSRPSLFPYDRWRPRLPELTEQYGRDAPFPHVHLTGFLDDAVTFRLAREFPRPDEASWIEYRHYNEKKLGKSRRADFPPFIGRLVELLYLVLAYHVALHSIVIPEPRFMVPMRPLLYLLALATVFPLGAAHRVSCLPNHPTGQA